MKIDRIEQSISYDNIYKCFENHINRYYSKYHDIIKDLIIDKELNTSTMNQFAMYRSEKEDKFCSPTYLLFYRFVNNKYYFFFISNSLSELVDKSVKDFTIFDIYDIESKYMFGDFSKCNSKFIIKFDTNHEKYYKENKLNFVELFNSNKVKFYNDDMI